MKFSIEKEVFKKFPTLVVALPIILGFDNTKAKEEILDFLRKTEENLRKSMSLDQLWKDPKVTAYLDCFKNFGVDPKKFVPAHVALAARVLEGGQLPDINPLVNVYNAMSIKYLTPFGGENLDALYGDFVLKFAEGGEQWIPIGGKKSKPAVTGELIWRDDFDLSTRALNWRQCDRTKMTGETKNGYFVMDGFSDVNRENIQKAADEFVLVAAKWFGGQAKIYWLDKENPTVDIPFSSRKIKPEILTDQSKFQFRKANPIQDRKANGGLPQLFSSIAWEGEGTLVYLLKQIVFSSCREIVGKSDAIKLDSVKIEHPKQENYGDYSTNIALLIAGRHSMRPQELAEKLVNRLNKYIKEHQLVSSLSDSLAQEDKKNTTRRPQNDPKTVDEILENVAVAGPGFVNLTIRQDYLITLIQRVLNSEKAVISTQLVGKKIAVEYTDPNPFKEFHLGHLYSNVIGESICRLFEGLGAKVWRGDFYGDVGMHIAKSVWGMMQKMDTEKVTLADLEKLSVKERQQFLGQGYALGVVKYDENEAIAENIRDINYLIYVAAQELLREKRGWKQIIDYRKFIAGKERELAEVQKIYEAGLRWSLAYFESIYKVLGTKFDGYYPESWVGEYGMKIAEKGLKMGVLEKDADAIVYKGSKDGLHTRVFVNKLGLPTYETKDLGLAYAKYQDFSYDLSINIFGKEIDEYYKVVKSALIRIEPSLGEKAYHIPHGMVRLPKGKMSSRTGTVITFEWLLKESKSRVLPIMKNAELGTGEKEEVVQKVALGAIRYALLRSGPEKDVVFDFDKSLSFDGDSGPYLMYTYARCKSVMRKSDPSASSTELLKSLRSLKEMNDEEVSLLRTFYRFPEVVTEAARNLSPNLICSFLFDLAQKYNLFYNKHSILGSYNKEHKTDNKNETIEFRLVLTATTAQIIKQGLYLLGIETVERM